METYEDSEINANADLDMISNTVSEASESDLSSSESDDWTSSSGSDSLNSDSGEDGPEEGTEVPPEDFSNRNLGSKGICHAFTKTGRCRRSKACPYRHERPTKGVTGPGSQTGKLGSDRSVRISLHQRVCLDIAHVALCADQMQLMDQERRNDDQKVLETILALGDHGHLDDDALDTR